MALENDTQDPFSATWYNFF